MLESARRGEGSSLVLLGEAGSGKSALLVEAAQSMAAEMTVASTAGVESEAPLAFAALQRLLRPMLSQLDAVPAPQARALRVAFGEESGDLGDRFIIFMGALSLLAAQAEHAPVLVLVDDAQWLDEASAAALHFVARRIAVERIAMLWAARPEDSVAFESGELPVLRLGGLDLAGVSAVLSEESNAAVTPEVAALLLANTGGNPLAIRELPAVLTAEQLSGRAPLPPRLPITQRIEQVFLDRARQTSEDAQTLLLVVSAADSARLPTVLHAARALGAGPETVAEVERSGLVSVDGEEITLRHPLVRSAVYSAAPSAERRRVHAALAAALTGDEDADRRAWHRASSVIGPDESVVADLVAAAERSERRGGHEAASAAWVRASELSTASAERARCLYAASGSSWIAAHPDRARQLVERAIKEASDPVLLAHARRLRARVEWNTGSVNLAYRMFMEAAAAVAAHEPALARELSTEAVSIAVWSADNPSDVSPTSLVPPPSADAPARERTYHQLLHGLGHVVAGDYAAAAELLRGAFETHRGLPEDYDLLPGLSIGAMHLGEFDLAETYMHRLLNQARTDGGLVMVLYALTRLSMIDLVAGRWSDALGDASEAVSLGELTGHPVLADTPAALLLLIAALRGEESTFDELAPRLDAAMSQGSAGVLGVVLRDVVHWAQGVRQAGRPATAFHHFGQMSHDLSKRMAGLDRVEAAVRSDQIEAAQMWVEELRAFATATGHAWAGAIAEHGQAVLAQPDAAESHFLAAIDLHKAALASATGRPFDLARTELAYGEFLRRARRRVDARTHLRAAHDAFESLRARPWQERAAAELRASGETVRKRRNVEDELSLTPQERQVAQLVKKGLSNKDVAAQLFVSPRTVDFHLRNVFAKSGVSSRAELVALALD